MKSKWITCLVLILCATSAYAGNQNCSAIVKQPAQQWVNQQSEKQSGSTINIVQAIANYRNCVDERLTQIYQHMLKTGSYPLMGANGNFQDFQAALKTFNQAAIKATANGGTIDQIEASYMQLYAKAFKLLFYAQYLKDTKYPLIERIKNTKRPDLAASKKYYKKMMQSYPQKQREELEKAFNKLVVIGEKENNFDPNIIYDYAINILQSLADKPFSPPLF